MNLRNFLIIQILVINTSLSAQNLVAEEALSIGETITVQSIILDEERLLNIYLPQGYVAGNERKYPVIYLLDGSLDEDFIHIAGLVQFSSFSWINMIPESIVVGIGNVDRRRDFTFPTQNVEDKKDFPTSGQSEKFIEFIKNELVDFIDNRYPTNGAKTLIGQSLGGLLATELLFITPTLFDQYIIVSPSLWWDDESLLEKSFLNKELPDAIYIAVGKEGEIMERTAKALYTKLSSAKSDQTQLFFKFLADQDHGDALHLAVYDAFEKFNQSQ